MRGVSVSLSGGGHVILTTLTVFILCLPLPSRKTSLSPLLRSLGRKDCDTIACFLGLR